MESEDNLDVFIKHDTNKIIVSEVEPSFILGTAEVLTFGAKKYARGNWKNMTEEDRQRIADSLLRHILQYLDGQECDSETNISHLYHASCNLMFLANLDKNKKRANLDGKSTRIINE